MGLFVAAARKALTEEPPAGCVANDQTLDFLEQGRQLIFGHFWEKLARWKAAGLQHVCIIPHGPLHFFPFHLLGGTKNLLADDFVVTYLPNLQLLNRSREGGQGRAETCASFGLGFDGMFPHGLRPLPDAVSEATEIARIFGKTPTVNDDATEEQFLEALQNCRYVHLATHGKQDVYAPAFHTVYLSPGPDSDGLLQAHEILELDLRGLELVTLSACETALGRFDSADNLRGLPSTLFLRGAQTLIGTLWSTHSDVSAAFFLELYRGLHDRKSRLLAFQHAQKQIRSRFPEYRDWGAFFYAGSWIDGDQDE
jgi:CHAT domain-containing protein